MKDSDTIRVFIVDDEPAAVRSLALPLRSAGIEDIVTCNSADEFAGYISSDCQMVVLLDLFMPEMVGDRILARLKAECPCSEVIIVTGDDSLETAVNLMREGASDYLVKPVEEGRLVASVRRSIELLELRYSNLHLKKGLLSRELEHPEAFSKITTRNDTMLDIFRYIEIIAPTSQPVLITGETGVGKELVAEAIHTLSGRNGDYVKINVAGLDDTLFSDTLFGHFKGAFTGASSRRPGMIERAENSTLLLDEIGSLPSQSQVKLLRLLQEKEYYPLGADVPRRTNARIIACSNLGIDQLQQSEQFRNDLFYRLRTHHLHIPPLRERIEDIPLILELFIKEAAAELGKKPPTPHPALPSLLATYTFPGNIRELRAMVYEAMARHTSHMLTTEVFSAFIPHAENFTQHAARDEDMEVCLQNLEGLPTLRQMDDLLVAEALNRSSNNQSLAARLLGITPSALNKRLRKNVP